MHPIRPPFHRISTTLATAALLLLPFAAAVPTAAQVLPQTDSAETLRRAQGTIFDWTELDPDPHWAFNGPFTLACGPTPCAQADPSAIQFDLTLAMVRPDGAQSHTHSFSSFSATSVTVIGDDLFIEGRIDGSGNVGGMNDVFIELLDVGTAGEFRMELLGNPHIIGALSGVIELSR